MRPIPTGIPHARVPICYRTSIPRLASRIGCVSLCTGASANSSGGGSNWQARRRRRHASGAVAASGAAPRRPFPPPLPCGRHTTATVAAAQRRQRPAPSTPTSLGSRTFSPAGLSLAGHGSQQSDLGRFPNSTVPSISPSAAGVGGPLADHTGLAVLLSPRTHCRPDSAARLDRLHPAKDRFPHLNSGMSNAGSS